MDIPIVKVGNGKYEAYKMANVPVKQAIIKNIAAFWSTLGFTFE